METVWHLPALMKSTVWVWPLRTALSFLATWQNFSSCPGTLYKKTQAIQGPEWMLSLKPPSPAERPAGRTLDAWTFLSTSWVYMNRGQSPVILGGRWPGIWRVFSSLNLVEIGNGASRKSRTKVCLVNMLIISFTQISFEHHFQRNNSTKSTARHPLWLA